MKLDALKKEKIKMMSQRLPKNLLQKMDLSKIFHFPTLMIMNAITLQKMHMDLYNPKKFNTISLRKISTVKAKLLI